jgi:signal transduction histidine kinase
LSSERRHNGRRREDRDRARLVDQLITAEHEERRRLADHLHDTAVQSLSAIALLLEAVLHSIEEGRSEDARALLAKALQRQRETIRGLRDLSFELEPVVLRDHGFVAAVQELADRLALGNEVAIELDVDAGDGVGGKAQIALYQIVREALHGAIRRGPPERIVVHVGRTDDDGVEATVADDARGERRRRGFEVIEERVRTLSGKLDVQSAPEGGTTVRVTLPPYSVAE